MPGMSGVDLVKHLRDRPICPKVVFVTAYENYAVPAFELRAVDYLLKPIIPDRLAETIQRLREAGQPAAVAATVQEEKKPALAFLMAEKDEKQRPLPLNDIVYIFSEGYNVWVQTYAERFQARYTLQELTERLPADQFFRCHRSYLINLFQVKEISPYFNGAYILKMKDKDHSEVLVSRANVKRLKELFAMD
jgi:two-component system LytT family response regulator